MEHIAPKPATSARANNWPITFDFLNWPSAFTRPVTTAGVGLVVILLVIAIFSIGWLLADLVSGDTKRAAEAVKAALPLLAATIGLPLIIWRLRILDRQTRIAEDKTRIDRETHYTSIFSRSIDQLGQTRDVKSSEVGDGDPVTRTAPNIEVRLGGIHSLVRLADESARDRDTIQNVLLSYVRENSWSDRNGVVTSLPLRARNLTSEWSYYYSRGKVTPEAEAELGAWEKKEAEASNKRRAWARLLKETRVDVNEATDAIPKVRQELSEQGPLKFYESLFVGTRIGSNVSNLSRFERCTFANCTFGGATRYRFLNCTFVDCTINDVVGGELSFSRCTIDHLNIHKLERSSLTLFASSASDLSVSVAESALVDLSHSNLHKPWISGYGEVELKFNQASLAQGYIIGLRASKSSDFQHCALAQTHLESLDLSEVEKISEAALARTVGNAGTRHPVLLPRPFAWPDFDPNFKEDDIPF